MNTKENIRNNLIQYAYSILRSSIIMEYCLEMECNYSSDKSEVHNLIQKYCIDGDEDVTCECEIIDGNIGDKIKFISADELYIQYFYFECGNILESYDNPFYLYVNLDENYHGIGFNSVERCIQNKPLYIDYVDKKITDIYFGSRYKTSFNSCPINYDGYAFYMNEECIRFDNFDYTLFEFDGNKLHSKEEFDNWINTEYNFDKFFDENNEPIRYEQDICNFKFDE